MTGKERELFYKLLIDLFLDHPSRRTHSSEWERERNTHEKVPTNARRPRRQAS